MSLIPIRVELRVRNTSEVTDGQVVRAGIRLSDIKIYCHDLGVTSSNPTQVELGVPSTSAQVVLEQKIIDMIW